MTPDRQSVRAHALPGGAQLAVIENESSPTISLAARIEAGEGAAALWGLPEGIAHYFEHMVCTSSRRYGIGGVTDRVEAAGGSWASITYSDHMEFHMAMPASFSRQAINMFVNSLCQSALTTEAVNAERSFIAGEDLDWRNNTPFSVFLDKARRSVYGEPPYLRPVTGTKESIFAVNPVDLQLFFQRAFVGPNVRLLVNGPVDGRFAEEAILASDFKLPEPDYSLPVLSLPFLFHGIDKRKETTSEGVRLFLAVPASPFGVDLKSGLLEQVMTDIVGTKLWRACHRPVGARFLQEDLVRSQAVSHAEFSTTLYPQQVSGFLKEMQKTLAGIAWTGAAGELEAFQRQTYRSTPSKLLASWATYGKIVPPEVERAIVAGLTPKEARQWAQKVLSGPYAFYAEGAVAGMPSRRDVSSLLGMKASASPNL